MKHRILLFFGKQFTFIYGFCRLCNKLKGEAKTQLPHRKNHSVALAIKQLEFLEAFTSHQPMKFTNFVTKLTLFIIVVSGISRPQELGVAAASDLQFVFKEITDRFEKQTGNSLRVSFGSSGNFFAQIQNGAPFDLFFSADLEYPQKLEAQGFGEPGTIYQYARGKIVLWIPNEISLDPNQGLKILLDPKIKKIAIANPAHAPYGRAAVAAFKSAGIYEKIADKLVFGENISQAAHFVASGNADAGILALSTALSPMIGPRGKYFVIPLDAYPALAQGAIILKASAKKDRAKCFLSFMQSPEIIALMKQYGFELQTPQKKNDEPCSCCRSFKSRS